MRALKMRIDNKPIKQPVVCKQCISLFDKKDAVPINDQWLCYNFIKNNLQFNQVVDD